TLPYHHTETVVVASSNSLTPCGVDTTDTPAASREGPRGVFESLGTALVATVTNVGPYPAGLAQDEVLDAELQSVLSTKQQRLGLGTGSRGEGAIDRGGIVPPLRPITRREGCGLLAR